VLRKLPPGTRVRVQGRLGTHLHPGGTKDNPLPFSRTWVIYMDVEKVEVVEAEKPAG
jgi:hypothetical protein